MHSHLEGNLWHTSVVVSDRGAEGSVVSMVVNVRSEGSVHNSQVVVILVDDLPHALHIRCFYVQYSVCSLTRRHCLLIWV